MPDKLKIYLPQQERTIETPGKITLLELLRHKQVFIATSCSGEARCGQCIVKILDGREQLHAPTIDEKEMLSREDFQSGMRLACQIWVECDLTIATDYW